MNEHVPLSNCVIACVVCAIIAVCLGALAGNVVAHSYWEKEAVLRGFAYYDRDGKPYTYPVGHATFRWRQVTNELELHKQLRFED